MITLHEFQPLLCIRFIFQPVDPILTDRLPIAESKSMVSFTRAGRVVYIFAGLYWSPVHPLRYRAHTTRGLCCERDALREDIELHGVL